MSHWSSNRYDTDVISVSLNYKEEPNVLWATRLREGLRLQMILHRDLFLDMGIESRWGIYSLGEVGEFLAEKIFGPRSTVNWYTGDTPPEGWEPPRLLDATWWIAGNDGDWENKKKDFFVFVSMDIRATEEECREIEEKGGDYYLDTLLFGKHSRFYVKKELKKIQEKKRRTREFHKRKYASYVK